MFPVANVLPLLHTCNLRLGTIRNYFFVFVFESIFYLYSNFNLHLHFCLYFLLQMSHLSCTRATSDLSPAGTTEKTTKLQQLQSNVSMPIAALLGQDKLFALCLDLFTEYRNAPSPNKSPKPIISTHPRCPKKN